VVKVVLFDVIGTTVRETDPALVARCVASAFAAHGIAVTPSQIEAHRGKEKREMIETLLKTNHRPTNEAASVYQSFQHEFADALHLFAPMAGATDLFMHLRNRGIKVGLGTGLPQELLLPLLTALRWQPASFDFIGCPAPGIRGRPAPDMIFSMMKKLVVNEPSHVLKVGDTVADIEEGKNAGVRTGALLSGTQPPALLQAATPDYLFASLDDVLPVIEN
jgi:phosphonatase-like hydrolase